MKMGVLNSMLKENDFKWLTRRANSIPTNPVDCYYCIVDTGDGTGKMYVVKPLHAQNTGGMVKAKQGYKYFVFLDCSVQRVPTDQRNFPHSMSLYSGYRVVSETLIAVFDTVEDAKKRAYTQYTHHFGNVLPHVVDDTTALTQKHFVVAE